MLSRNFGLNTLRNNRYLDELMTNSPAMDSDASQIMLSMGYDIAYGIHDHSNANSNNPLNIIAVHEAEDISKSGGIYKSMTRYMNQGIQEHFGITYTEYISLPKDIIATMTELLVDRVKEAKRIADKEEAKAKHDTSN